MWDFEVPGASFRKTVFGLVSILEIQFELLNIALIKAKLSAVSILIVAHNSIKVIELVCTAFLNYEILLISRNAMFAARQQ